MNQYNFKEIEVKWSQKWVDDKLFTPDLAQAKNPYYALFMFPYPSAEGLHIGNFYAFTCVDVMAKYKRLRGEDVFEPIGWDAFGIHSENYALKIGETPRKMLNRTIKNFRQQLVSSGISCDWTREVDTTTPEYYKWTQWIFTKMMEKDLAFQKEALLNWCPDCKTVLADEQIENEKCERCGATPEKKKMKQWFLKITAYAQRLLDGLEEMDWSEITKAAQRNWIGRSEGAEIDFIINDNKVTVYTTRPDTLFGATYFVLSPEHPIVEKITTEEQKQEVEKYIKEAGAKSDLERTENKEKTGVFTGAYAINPVNQEKIPVWIADYVLMGYGTGAIMAVPAHDERDFEFAKKYELEIRPVISPDLGSYNSDQKIDKMFDLVKEITDKFKREKMKFWFIGTIAVSAFYQKLFAEPADIDFGVLTKDYKQANKFLKDLGYELIEEKENEQFKHNIYKKGEIIIQLGTFDQDLGDLILEFQNVKYPVADPAWLAECYRITASKDRRKDKNDLERAIFLDYYAQKKPQESYIGDGKLINSDFLNGLDVKQGIEKIIKWLEDNKVGKGTVNYKLRDWCISRQRYWGPPVPVIYCPNCGPLPVPEKDLPVLLPELEEGWEPAGDGRGPLAKVEEFMNTKCPQCGGPAQREADVMDNFLDSAWYFFRYVSPQNQEEIFDPQLGKKWFPVDLYIGGNEHAVLHLMYTRFITMVLHDLKLIDFDDPFKRFRANGMILKDGAKMSKSKGNVVNPEEYGEKVGYDALKTYLLFLGPLNEDRSFTDKGVQGTKRWVEKIFKLKEKITADYSDSAEIVRKLHQTIRSVTDDFEEQKYNTAVAKLMELTNLLAAQEKISLKVWQDFLIIITPFTPCLSEELWEQQGNSDSIFKQSWPEYDDNLAKEDMLEIPIQINGKMRAKIMIAEDLSEDQVKEQALADQAVIKWLEGKEVKKFIYVPGKIVNIVL